MIQDVWSNIIYFLNLTLSGEVVWIIFPLAFATIVMLVYFEKYKHESPGWNTHVANSLILLFVSVILFRYIYGIDSAGVVNFANYFSKFFISFFMFILGLIILFLNFKHFMPENIAEYVSSPLTLNLIAYTVILYVFSEVESGWISLISLLIIFSVLLLFFNLARISLERFFAYMQEIKNKEEVERIKQEKKPIKERRKQIRRIQAEIKKEEGKIKMKEKDIIESVFKKINKQNKQEKKIKKSHK